MGQIDATTLSLFQRLARYGAGQGLKAEEAKQYTTERGQYMKRHADGFEKKLGKTYFEFDRSEELDYQIAEENARRGNLDLTDGTRYFCGKCNNKGYVAMKDDYGNYVEATCGCMKVRDSIKDAYRQGLGNIYGRLTLDSFHPKQTWQGIALDMAKNYIAHGGNSWFIAAGKSGSGKTHLCTAVVGEIMKREKLGVNYVQWLDTITELTNTRFRNTERFEAIMGAMQNADILYLDDFLKTENGVKPPASEMRLAYMIINRRYIKSQSLSNASQSGRKYLTVISTEFTLDQLVAFDAATGGRIAEMCSGFVCEFKGSAKNMRVVGGDFS